MTPNRYGNDPLINLGRQRGTNVSLQSLRTAIKNGSVPIVQTIVATGDDRLDTLAGALYGDAGYWWVLAAASDIGWGLQIPPGTIINVVRISDVQEVI